MPAHPHDHVRDARDGDERQDPLHDLPLLERQRKADEVEPDGDGDTYCRREQNPQPYETQGSTLASLTQKRRDDAHDERGFEALAEADDERRKQGGSPLESSDF